MPIRGLDHVLPNVLKTKAQHTSQQTRQGSREKAKVVVVVAVSLMGGVRHTLCMHRDHKS